MSSWYEGILEIDDIYDYQYDKDVFSIRLKDKEKFTYYSKCLGEYLVFRYVYVDCTCNSYYKSKFKIFKNCFVLSAIREKDGFIVNFNYGENLKDDELKNVLRGIKLNKLKRKIKSTI